MSRHALQGLLDAEMDFAVEYERGPRAVAGARAPGDSALATHHPMALHALADLGASAAQLQAWFAQSQAQAARAIEWPALTEREQELLGDMDRYGLEGVLRRQLPALMPHAGSVAFHALIRTAHAWEAGHPAQLARALAWWAQRELPMPQMLNRPPLPLSEWWLAMLKLPRPRGGLISHRMRAASLEPAFAAWAPTLQLEADTPRQLARTIARAYASSGNFTLLHGVTGTRAFQVLAPLLEPGAQQQALRDFSLHLAAALCASGWSGEDGPLPDPLPWPTLIDHALQPGQDEHVIKLIHAARWFDAREPDPFWQQVAARTMD